MPNTRNLKESSPSLPLARDWGERGAHFVVLVGRLQFIRIATSGTAYVVLRCSTSCGVQQTSPTGNQVDMLGELLPALATSDSDTAKCFERSTAPQSLNWRSM